MPVSRSLFISLMALACVARASSMTPGKSDKKKDSSRVKMEKMKVELLQQVKANIFSHRSSAQVSPGKNQPKPAARLELGEDNGRDEVFTVKPVMDNDQGRAFGDGTQTVTLSGVVKKVDSCLDNIEGCKNEWKAAIGPLLSGKSTRVFLSCADMEAALLLRSGYGCKKPNRMEDMKVELLQQVKTKIFSHRLSFEARTRIPPGGHEPKPAAKLEIGEDKVGEVFTVKPVMMDDNHERDFGEETKTVTLSDVVQKWTPAAITSRVAKTNGK